MSWTSLRSIIEEDAASAARDGFEQQFPRFEEAWMALTWLLSRDPHKGLRRKVGDREYRVYVQAGDILARTPDIWVVFTFDDNEVIIYGLHAEAQGATSQSVS